MMGFMFGTTQDVQAADLSEAGKMRLKELVPVAGVDSVAKYQQLLAYAGKGDWFRHVKGEGKGGRSGGNPLGNPSASDGRGLPTAPP